MSKRPEYVRLAFRSGGKPRMVWAIKLASGRYQAVTKEGDTSWLVRGVERTEYILADPADIISERPAQFSLKYGELEIST